MFLFYGLSEESVREERNMSLGGRIKIPERGDPCDSLPASPASDAGASAYIFTRMTDYFAFGTHNDASVIRTVIHSFADRCFFFALLQTLPAGFPANNTKTRIRGADVGKQSPYRSPPARAVDCFPRTNRQRDADWLPRDPVMQRQRARRRSQRPTADSDADADADAAGTRYSGNK